jgi:hypothetical protein
VIAVVSDRPTRLTARVRSVAASPPVPSRPAQRLLIAGRVVLFVGAAVVAASRLPPPSAAVRWWFLLPVAGIGVPASVLLNAVEFRVSARMAGTRVGFGRAVVV